MKKSVMFLVLALLVAALAFANLSNRFHQKQSIEKKQDANKSKKECKRTCIFG